MSSEAGQLCKTAYATHVLQPGVKHLLTRVCIVKPMCDLSKQLMAIYQECHQLALD